VNVKDDEPGGFQPPDELADHDADTCLSPAGGAVLPRIPKVGNDQGDLGGAVLPEQPVECQQIEK